MNGLTRRNFLRSSALFTCAVLARPSRADPALKPISQGDFLAALRGWVTYNANRILSVGIARGGWEKWAQAEIGAGFNLDNMDYSREETSFSDGMPIYPGNSRQSADFVLNYASRRNVSIVELKCQTKNQDLNSFNSLLVGDVAKLMTAAQGTALMAVGIRLHEQGGFPDGWQTLRFGSSRFDQAQDDPVVLIGYWSNRKL